MKRPKHVFKLLKCSSCGTLIMLETQIVCSDGLFHVYLKPESHSDTQFQLLLGVYKTHQDAVRAIEYIHLTQYGAV